MISNLIVLLVYYVIYTTRIQRESDYAMNKTMQCVSDNILRNDFIKSSCTTRINYNGTIYIGKGSVSNIYICDGTLFQIVLLYNS